MTDQQKAIGAIVGGFFAGMATFWLAYKAAKPALIARARDNIVSASLQQIPARYGELAQALRVPGVAEFVADQVAAAMTEKLP